MKQEIICPDCGSEMVLRETKKYTYKNGVARKFFGCVRFPDCTATHGAHPDGKPLGVPADSDTKMARIELHDVCRKIWGEPKRGKRPMYEWLKKNALKEHIGEMSLDDIEKTKSLLKLYNLSQ